MNYIRKNVEATKGKEMMIKMEFAYRRFVRKQSEKEKENRLLCFVSVVDNNFFFNIYSFLRFV